MRTSGAAPWPVPAAEGTQQRRGGHGRRAAGSFPPSSFLERGREKKKANIQGEERGPRISCRSHGSGGMGREKSRRHFVLLTQRGERSPGSWQPRSPKKGIRKFRPGRNRGWRLCSCAHGEPRRRGRAAPTWRGGGEGQVQPSPGASFVLRPHLWTRRGCGTKRSLRRAAGRPQGARPKRCAGQGREVLGSIRGYGGVYLPELSLWLWAQET